MAKADFDNLLAVLRCERPARPTLFEYFLNEPLYAELAGPMDLADDDPHALLRRRIRAFAAAGYDYATVEGSDFAFPTGDRTTDATLSINEGHAIRTREDFDAFDWPDPDAADWSRLDALAGELDDGMKFVVPANEGLLETVIFLVGYETLCFMLVDEPDLVADLFNAAGSRLVRYYEIAAAHPMAGACIVNDDWGFKTQPLISPGDLRQYVFPWHRKTVQAIHAAGKPAILHSCGQPAEIIDDIIDDMGYDGKHSYEDEILPVEQAYEQWHGRIAVLGGIDLDFMCRSAADQVYERSKAMLRRAAQRGGYALGTGNSVPEYVPNAAYFAMIRAATECRD